MEKGMATHSSILAWEIPWTEDPGGSDGKEAACSVGDPGSIPGSGRSPGGGTGNPLQYSCLGNPMDREAWWALVQVVAKNWIQLSNQEKVMAPHSSTLAWKTPWMEEPGRLQFMGSQSQTRLNDFTFLSFYVNGMYVLRYLVAQSYLTL